MNHTHKQIMAHILVPLCFLILGYSVIYIAMRPVVEMTVAVSRMMMAREAPDFGDTLTSIYEEQEIVPLNAVPLSEVVIPYLGSHYGELSNEKVGLKVPVYYGDSGAILLAGAGHFAGSFLPGFNRTILISAHNQTFFAPLEFIEVGDEFVFKTNYGHYVYKVKEISIHLFSDQSAYDLGKEEEELILYTCYDFAWFYGRKRERIFFYCDRISGPDVVSEAQW